ncbi:MAG: hypothetical protein AAF226_08685 [Verrucomicrobiota bacterium]
MIDVVLFLCLIAVVIFFGIRNHRFMERELAARSDAHQSEPDPSPSPDLIKSILVIDVETGGLDPRENPLLEVAILPLDGLDEGYERRWRGVHLPSHPKALEVNGLDPRKGWVPLKATRDLNHYLQHLAKKRGIDRFILAGMNPRFDLDFLRENLTGYGYPCAFSHRTLDMHTLVAGCSLAQGVDIDHLTTDEIYRRLGLPEEPRPHSAMRGALWERRAFRKLLPWFFDDAGEMLRKRN